MTGSEPKADLHRYLRLLEQSLIDALATWGLTAGRIPGLTGVWLGEEKVAATGGLEEPTLPRAEVKRLLQLGCCARPLGTEKRKGRIRGDDRSLVRAEKVAGVLGCEDE